jgi:hypothetical protein
MRPPGRPPGLPKNGVGDREHGQRFAPTSSFHFPQRCFYVVPRMSPILKDLWIPPFFQLRLPIRFLCRIPDLQLYPLPRP